MSTNFKDKCPFCDYKIISYDEFVQHAEFNHVDDYLSLIYDKESGIIELIQVDEIISIEKSEE